MKKPSRIKAPALKSLAEFQQAVDEVARLEAAITVQAAELDTNLQQIREAYEPTIAGLEGRRDALMATAEKYATENPDVVLPGKTKSAETALATYGFRLGNPTLKLLSKKWTWDNVLAALKAEKLSRFVRPKEEVDKDACKTHLKPEQLAQFGLRVDQEESFYIAPKDANATKVA